MDIHTYIHTCVNLCRSPRWARPYEYDMYTYIHAYM